MTLWGNSSVQLFRQLSEAIASCLFIFHKLQGHLPATTMKERPRVSVRYQTALDMGMGS